MSLISGSYSRLPLTGGAALLREVMVEKELAVAARGAIEAVGAARRAIGLIARLRTVDRWRSVRDAVLHRLRLKADMVSFASRAQ
jgi:hypothetical protein